MRPLAATLAFLMLAFTLPAAQTGKDRLVGNWKISFLDGSDIISFWMLKIDNKLTGKIEEGPKAPKATADKLVMRGDNLEFNLDFDGQPVRFSVKLPKGDSTRLLGTMTFQADAYPVQLVLTKNGFGKDEDPVAEVPMPKGGFKELKEDLAKRTGELGVFAVARAMLDSAINEKVAPADIKAALAPALQAAGNYGDWRQEVLMQFARRCSGRDGDLILSEQFAQDALKELGPNAATAKELLCLDLIALSLGKQDKQADLAKIRARIDKAEVKGYAENERAGLPFGPAKFNRTKGNRVVLVELFTGAHCPPCVAADLAFEGLAKTYAPSAVVLLQYHLHIPQPDPLTTPDTIARSDYYGEDVKGTPSIFFNGKAGAGGGGYRQHARGKYNAYRDVIDPLLEGDNKVRLTVEGRRAGDTLTVTAAATGYKPSEKLKLRMAVYEPWVRFAGSNGLSYHAHVVRALPGGAAGFSLAKDNVKETAKVDLAALRQTVSKHLDEFPFLEGQRPFSYRNFRLVAFVQDDDTKDVLHAVEVAVK